MIKPNGIDEKSFIENPVMMVRNNNHFQIELLSGTTITSYDFVIKATMRDGVTFFTEPNSLTVVCPTSVSFDQVGYLTPAVPTYIGAPRK